MADEDLGDSLQAAWPLGLQRNPVLVWGITFELTLILAAVYTPFGNLLFGTAPLPLAVWVLMLPMAMLMALLEEGRKAWARRRLKHRASLVC